MCGISGAIELKNNTTIDFSENSIVDKSIKRRGPDSYSFLSQEYNQFKITLAHSRLSIIDLSSASNQPFCSEDNRYKIIFNGEIYNYIEIKKELKALGCYFRTEGDTEVLLNAWIYWGATCLSKLNGMFSFAIFDSVIGELNIVRDRFGVKPLVYSFLPNGGLFFSSSVDAVALISNNLTLDMDYLSRGYHYGVFEGIGNNTSYNNVNYLEAGSIATITFNPEFNFSIKKWYDLKSEVEKNVQLNLNKTYEQLKEECKLLIFDAVNIRLRSDVPVAVSLSGGVDSTIISKIAKSMNPNIQGFTFGSPKDPLSEGNLVDMFANLNNFKVNYISIKEVNNEVIKAFEETFSAQELPFFGLSIVAQNQVYNSVKANGVKVLLGGQGGDEIFAGYRKFFIHSLKNSISNNDVSTSINLLYSLGNMMLYESKKISLFWGFRNRYFSQKSSKESNIINIQPINRLDMIGDASMNCMERQMIDILQLSIPTLLRYEDKNSMYHSIESRLPMMDYRLVEFAISLPILYKIKHGFGKWILRDIYKDDIPKEILFNKRKRGFDVSQKLMELGLQDYLIENILSNRSKLKNFGIDINEKNIFLICKKSKHLRDNDLLFLNYLIRKS
jgi:asparagine synthase (glutamine-hydrolysing)